jgi:hypothetical protein
MTSAENSTAAKSNVTLGTPQLGRIAIPSGGLSMAWSPCTTAYTCRPLHRPCQRSSPAHTGPAMRVFKKLSIASALTSSCRWPAQLSKTLFVRATSASATKRSSYSRPTSSSPWTCPAQYGQTFQWLCFNSDVLYVLKSELQGLQSRYRT